MAFNANEWLAAQKIERPQFTHGDRTWVGEILSMDQWAPIAEQLAGLQDKDANIFTVRLTFKRIIDLIFPRPWWQFWRPRASKYFLRMPLRAQEEAIRDFLASQGQALGLDLAPTLGSSSPQRGSAEPKKTRRRRRVSRTSSAVSSGSMAPTGTTGPATGQPATE